MLVQPPRNGINLCSGDAVQETVLCGDTMSELCPVTCTLVGGDLSSP